MSNDDMSDLVNNLKGMLDNGDLPDNLQDILSNFSSNNTGSDTNSTGNNNDNTTSDTSNRNNNSSSSDGFNMDIETIMKMKTIMDKMNSPKNDPRSNLLLSLKPYLKDSRKGKLDQYVQLMNMGNVMEMFNMTGGDKAK